MLKSINNEARPFFVADLKPYKCRLEHGNPSGHALIVVALYATFLDLFIRQYPKLRNSKIQIWFVYVLFIAFIGFGRIYNGVHTHNQVLAGYVWGFVIYYTFCHIFYLEIHQFITSIGKKTRYELYWNPLTQCYAICYGVAICLYFYGSHNHPTP